MVDNIQLKVNNIHVRLEDQVLFSKPVSLGLTLQEIKVSTTNEEWNDEFIDRTLQETKAGLCTKGL